MTDEIIVKTPFVIQNYTNIESFITTIFPDLESYIKEQITQGIQKSNLNNIAYSQLQSSFVLFIVRNFSKEIDDYLGREASHANKEVMKQVLISTISITLNVTDEDGNKLVERDFLNALRNIINKIY
jgi:hypothetical protein